MKAVSLSAETEQKGNIGFVTGAVFGRQKAQKTDGEKEINGKDNQVKNDDATLQISEEAMEKYREMQNLLYNMEAAKQQGDAMEDTVDNMGKVMAIFRRICHGDIVPQKDEKMLMEYSTELYQAAKMCAAMAKNKHPKKYKSVEEEEDAAVKGVEESDSTGLAEMAEGGAEADGEVSVEE